MLEDMCAICLKISFNNVWRHVSTMFKDMFTSCLQTGLHHVYTMFKDMFPPNLKICLHNVKRHVCYIFEDKLKPCSKTCLHHVYIYFYTMLEHKFSPYLKISFHYVVGHVCNIFGDKFLHLIIRWRFLPLNFLRHDILLWFFKSENVNYTFHISRNWK